MTHYTRKTLLEIDKNEMNEWKYFYMCKLQFYKWRRKSRALWDMTSSPIKTNRERNSFLLKGIKYINKYCALSDQNMNEKCPRVCWLGTYTSIECLSWQFTPSPRTGNQSWTLIFTELSLMQQNEMKKKKQTWFIASNKWKMKKNYKKINKKPIKK